MTPVSDGLWKKAAPASLRTGLMAPRRWGARGWAWAGPARTEAPAQAAADSSHRMLAVPRPAAHPGGWARLHQESGYYSSFTSSQRPQGLESSGPPLDGQASLAALILCLHVKGQNRRLPNKI